MRTLRARVWAGATIALWLLPLLGLAPAGCTTIPDGCDEEAMRTVVYSMEGHPAFAGQALLHSSCGFGAFCHASGAQGSLRHGTPAGFDLDIEPASYDTSAGDVDRLRHAQETALQWRDAIWREVERGTMPPGEAGERLLDNGLRPRYRLRSEGRYEDLPELSTVQGREVLRNWLACGAPVIERTQERADGAPSSVGAVVAAVCAQDEDCPFSDASRCDVALGECAPCEGDADCAHVGGQPLCALGRCVAPAEPTWPSIYEVIVTPTCALEFCHGDDEGNNEGMLDLRDRAGSYARLFTASESEECGYLGLPIVTPGEPEQSLLYRKLFALEDGEEEDSAICGYRMPYAAESPLPSPWIETIAQWIRDGAQGP